MERPTRIKKKHGKLRNSFKSEYFLEIEKLCGLTKEGFWFTGWRWKTQINCQKIRRMWHILWEATEQRGTTFDLMKNIN